MAVSVQMPKQGNTVVECLLVEWKVGEGDRVEAGDVLCAIETDKASFEIPAPEAGTVLKLLVRAGDLVPVLSDIAIIGGPGEDPGRPASPAPVPEPAAPAPPPPGPATPAGIGAPSGVPAAGGAPISPRGRKLAEKLGVEASRLPGSGPGGRVTSRDVRAAAESGLAARTSRLAGEIMAAGGRIAGPPSGIGGLYLARDLAAPGAEVPPASGGEEAEAEAVPYKGVRKLVGDRMRQSLEEHAQLTLDSSADASGLLAQHQFFKEHGEAAGLPRITLNDLLCWVTARTLTGFPEVNATFDRAGGVILRRTRVNLAVAVDTPRGLLVPVVADAHRLSLSGLSLALAKLADDCRKGSINPDLLAGGTFTVSNLGGLGVERFTPIINSPQAAILGICAVGRVPAPGEGGGLVLKPRIGLSLTIDHQLVDGAPAARFLRELVRGIENVQASLALRGAR
ncbi:MAG: 2-oxo acid dehydrogenase subunit E2 [Planctomycetota bacterium]|jgi:pyruvate dehydrogenase E2 component (dihydrolipoamide acetyltransferase)|nr:2-oxo acid dehydrogenase subunit E2 [Planctomycetota bacterium]